MSLFKFTARLLWVKFPCFRTGGLKATPPSACICVLSECVLSGWWSVRLEVGVEGHYLQPERAASASSFSPSSLPASGLAWKTTGGVLSATLDDVRYCRCCTRDLAPVKNILTRGTSQASQVSHRVRDWSSLWNLAELFTQVLYLLCNLEPLGLRFYILK